MTNPADETDVLRERGDVELGAGNGSAGQGLSDLVVESSAGRPVRRGSVTSDAATVTWRRGWEAGAIRRPLRHFDGGHIKFLSVATLTNLVRPSFDVEQVEFYGRVPGFWKNIICVARKRAA